MKTQFTKLLTLSLCLLCLGISSYAQDLTGIWRLKTSKVTSGPGYANAVPNQMTINQTPDKIEFKITSDLGGRDTVINQMLAFKNINENLTKTGKKRLISFQKKSEHSWLKRTKIFLKENPNERQSIDEENYTIDNDGTTLNLYRKYDANEDRNTGNEDFTVEATYEKVDPEKLARETATGKGVNFTEGLSWEQIRAKAKAENKYIFVDCYATWCGPCKQMDKDIYPLAPVGDAMNEKFISIKLQMDSTKKDTESIKQHHGTAREFEKKYNIAGFPTYLFFSPDGEIVHKAMGFQKVPDFIRLIHDVQLPEKQLYVQIKSCREGKMDVNLVPVFLQRLKDGGDDLNALELARLYMKSYLENLSESKFLAKKTLKFIFSNEKMLRSEDRIYKLCFTKSKVIDSIYNIPEFAKSVIYQILCYEVVLPKIEDAKKNRTVPNWKEIKKELAQKSNKNMAQATLIDAKYYWYSLMEDWENACDYVIIKFQLKDFKKLQPDQISFELNQVAWTLFEYSFSKKQLEQGLTWINEALVLDESNGKYDPGRLDTKANLLYKLGRKEEAIILQEKAVSMLKNSRTELHATLEKMKEGKPTWAIGIKENKQIK